MNYDKMHNKYFFCFYIHSTLYYVHKNKKKNHIDKLKHIHAPLKDNSE